MTISSTTNRNDYVGTGTTGPFAYTFKIFAATDLAVTKRDAVTDAETPLAYPADFSVAGVGNAAGGSITLTDVLSDGDILTIRRIRPLTQQTSLRNQGSYFPETIEDAFDHALMIAQQQQDDLDRSMKLPETVSADAVSAELPVPVGGKALGWNADGTAIEHLDVTPIESLEVLPVAGEGDFVVSAVTHLASNAISKALRLDRLAGWIARLAGIYVVTDPKYGAGAGLADNTGPILAALADAATKGATVVRVPQGDFHLTTVTASQNSDPDYLLRLGADGLQLVGCGYGTNLIYSGAADTDVVQVGGSRCAVANLRITGPNPNDLPSILLNNTNGVHFISTTDHGRADGLYVSGCHGNLGGIDNSSANRATVTRCFVTHCNLGILQSNGGGRLIAGDNTLIGNSSGYEIYGIGGSITGGYIEGWNDEVTGLQGNGVNLTIGGAGGLGTASHYAVSGLTIYRARNALRVQGPAADKGAFNVFGNIAMRDVFWALYCQGGNDNRFSNIVVDRSGGIDNAVLRGARLEVNGTQKNVRTTISGMTIRGRSNGFAIDATADVQDLAFSDIHSTGFVTPYSIAAGATIRDARNNTPPHSWADTAKVLQTAAAAIASGAAFTALSFDTELYDDPGYFTPTSPTLFTIPANRGGLYRIKYHVTITSGATAGVAQLRIRNGAEVLSRDYIYVPASSTITLKVSTVAKLLQAQTILGEILQNTGNSWTVSVGADELTYAELTRIGS